MFQRNNKKTLGAKVALGITALAFTTMIGVASNALASPLGVGGAVTPTPLITLPGGDTLVPGATLSNPFTGVDGLGNTKFTGTLTSQVYIDPGTGGLDFLYIASNDPSSIDAFDELSLKSFATFSTDVDYVNGTGVSPSSATRSNDIGGKNVAFFFSSGVSQGSSTAELLVETNATNYMTGVGSVIDGGTGGAISDAPAVGMLMTNVPEPASFSAIVIAGGMLLGRRRR